MSEVKEYYTPKEVAEKWGVSVFTVQELLRKGRLEGSKLTTNWRVSRKSMEQFMSDNSNKQELLEECHENNCDKKI